MRSHIFYVLISFFSCTLISTGELFAQQRDTTCCIHNTTQTHEQCQSIMKIKKDYIHKNLVLTETESIKFWPIYDEYLRQEASIYDAHRYALDNNKIKSQGGRLNLSEVSDEEILFYLDQYYKTREATTSLEKKLYLDLKNVLKPETLYDFLQIERSFKSRVREKSKGACPRSR
ncbi:MAG TPA: hypothetical protein PLH70_01560 [Bacteroidales bacterium]|nr:hypothetical protein [Bacteroidales bacterium]HOH22204.1 hypothetical protein [Bacteroidales bacterium]HPZ02629.1 hypothetical protein [Bacteroidales bacterium]HQB74472.1 hypothetical protein [Bacteroidales bacterium]